MADLQEQEGQERSNIREGYSEKGNPARATRKARPTIMGHSPPFPSLGGASTTSDWVSDDRLWTSQSTACSSNDSSRSSGIFSVAPKDALSDLHSSSSSSLLGLQLSPEDMPEFLSNLAEYHGDSPPLAHAEDDLTLSPHEDGIFASAAANSYTVNTTNVGSFSNGDASQQPWRRFWPPTPGSTWFRQVASQRPDVLSFSFNPRNHLLHQNHPWQAWKNEHPKDDPQDTTDEPEIDVHDTYLQTPPYTSPCPRPCSPVLPSVQQSRNDLDDLVQVDLRLPSVTPEQFNYLRPLERYERERPYRLQLPPNLVPLPSTNVVTASYPVRIHDISRHEDRFTLDTSGFQFFKCPVPVGEWSDQAVTDTYLPALCNWVVPLLGGDSAMPYSFNFRHHSRDRFVPVQRPWQLPRKLPSTPHTQFGIGGDDRSYGEEDRDYSIRRFLATDRVDNPFNMIVKVEADPQGPCHWKRPLFRVHCDASDNTHKCRLPIIRPDDHQSLSKGRVRLISVWRTLTPHVQDTPLALCDARTVNREDLVPMDIVYPHFVDEVYEVKHNESHRWFYKKGMDTDDVVIFNLNDTHHKDKVCPHSAFVDPKVPSNTPPRASIEVKIMVFGGAEDGGTE